MAKNFFITKFTSGNYVKCPKSTKAIRVDLGCQKCDDFHGGGIYQGKLYINCSLLDKDSNIQMELEIK